MKNLFLTTITLLLLVSCSHEKQNVKLNEGLDSNSIEFIKNQKVDSNNKVVKSSAEKSESECVKACCSEK